MGRKWLALVLVLTLGGCLRTRTIDFTVPPPDVQMKAAWAQSLRVKVSVADKRLDRTNVGRGSVRGSSMHNAVTQTNKPLDEALLQGIKAELQARGVPAFDGPAFLLVDINKADSVTAISSFNVDVEAQAELAAQVLGADGRVHYQHTYKRTEAGKGEAWTMETYEQGAYRLQKVMGTLVRELVDDDQLIQALLAASRG